MMEESVIEGRLQERRYAETQLELYINTLYDLTVEVAIDAEVGKSNPNFKEFVSVFNKVKLRTVNKIGKEAEDYVIELTTDNSEAADIAKKYLMLLQKRNVFTIGNEEMRI